MLDQSEHVTFNEKYVRGMYKTCKLWDKTKWNDLDLLYEIYDMKFEIYGMKFWWHKLLINHFIQQNDHRTIYLLGLMSLEYLFLLFNDGWLAILHPFQQYSSLFYLSQRHMLTGDANSTMLILPPFLKKRICSFENREQTFFLTEHTFLKKLCCQGTHTGSHKACFP